MSLYVGASDEKNTSWFAERWTYCFANVLIGAGGAWAILLALLWANHAPLDNGLKDELQLLASCIVAGYAGNRVMPLVAEQLTKKAILKAQKTTIASAKSAAKSELTSEVLAYLDSRGNQSSHQTEAYIKKLRRELKAHPTSRKPAILLARLLDELQSETQKSILVLETFITAKENAGEGRDADVADICWNLANYYEQRFQKGGAASRPDRIKAMEYLARSISIIPAYSQDYITDPDLSKMKDDQDAKRLLPFG